MSDLFYESQKMHFFDDIKILFLCITILLIHAGDCNSLHSFVLNVSVCFNCVENLSTKQINFILNIGRFWARLGDIM